FFGAAALAMRRILVEQARRKGRLKHGGDRKRIEIDDAGLAIEPPVTDVLAVDRAVRRLEADDPRKGKIVNLRYFAGLTAKETAAALDLSVGTIEREWRFIKAWLQVELAAGQPAAQT
ncbi:MAG: ECF-type sigma factor, partial [Acidobacteriota bacterium]